MSPMAPAQITTADRRELPGGRRVLARHAFLDGADRRLQPALFRVAAGVPEQLREDGRQAAVLYQVEEFGRRREANL